MDVAIQVFAFDEPADTLTETLLPIKDQPLPDGAKADHQAWITPTGPDDTAMDVARSVGFESFESRQGKISARNDAHNHAAENGVDVIVTWDADAPPLADDTLANLLDPFTDDSVVAVNSLPTARKTPANSPSLIGTAVDLGGLVEDLAVPHVHGQCSAFRAEAWAVAGPFDESIDQTDAAEMRAEEEIAFYRRLQRLGDVTFAQAPVYNNPRRHLCRVPGMGGTEYCQKRGEETFYIDD